MPGGTGFGGDDRILLDSRRVVEASPISLDRRTNSAAVFRFRVPIKTLPSDTGIQPRFRQGSRVEFYHDGSRFFYGFLPSVSADRRISDDATWVDLAAHDIVGQMQDSYVTIGATGSSYLDPAGAEIGGFVNEVSNRVLSGISQAGELAVDGMEGTRPAQTIATADVKTGSQTAKAAIDWATALAFDDSNYPDAPLLYEYQQRDAAFVWRKQRFPNATNAVMRFSIGYDAVVDGVLSTMPVFSDAAVTAADGRVWTQTDEDTSRRRWGGKRFYATGKVTTTDSGDAQTLATRLIELGKLEQVSLKITVRREAALLHPGDIVAIYNPQSRGLPYDNYYRVQEVRIRLSPSPRTDLVLGSRSRLLTDYVT